MARIAFDTSSLNHPFNSGIQRYTRNLLKGLLSLEKTHTYILIGGDSGDTWNGPFEQPPPHLPSGNSGIVNALLSLMARVKKADLLFRPWGTLPEKRACPGVLTIHDTIPLSFPSWVAHTSIIDLFKESLPKTLPHTDAIIAVSHQTKRDIIQHYGVDERRIHVIHHGVEPAFFLEKRKEEPLRINGINIEGPYILSTGVFEPRKNRERLIAAYNNVRAKHTKEHWKLVLTGPSGWQYETVNAAIRSSPFKDDIILTGEVDEPSLRALYAGAYIFTYPSLYEGFGLPVLEAMAAGAPTITSNCSSLPEVGAEAALYCDPQEVDSIEQALEKLLLDEALRKSLSQKGRERARLFTWEKTAQDSLAVFEKILS